MYLSVCMCVCTYVCTYVANSIAALRIEYSLKLMIKYSQIVYLLIYRFKMSEQQLLLCFYCIYEIFDEIFLKIK